MKEIGSQKIEFTSDDWNRRKQFFGFEKGDEQILSELRLAAHSYIDEVIRDLYDWFFKFDEVKVFFTDDAMVQRVKDLQKKHFLTLTGGDYGMDFVGQRLQVGKIHRRIGLSAHLFMGAYSFYMQAMLPRVLGSFEYDRIKQARATIALVKLIALDQALVLQAYFEETVPRLP